MSTQQYPEVFRKRKTNCGFYYSQRLCDSAAFKKRAPHNRVIYDDCFVLLFQASRDCPQ